MLHRKTGRVLPAALLLCGMAVMEQGAWAGPPLICHRFEINNAKSLPWTGGEWREVDPSYDLNRLAPDTLALLSADTAVLVRMETMRRATVYAVWSQRDREVGMKAGSDRYAEELLAALRARAKAAPGESAEAARAQFDLGYLLASYQQAGYKGNRTAMNPEAYALVRQAGAALRDPAVEFALALMTRTKDPAHRGHIAKAVAGTEEGSLLARNLVKQFGEPGQTLAALRVQVAAARP